MKEITLPYITDTFITIFTLVLRPPFISTSSYSSTHINLCLADTLRCFPLIF